MKLNKTLLAAIAAATVGASALGVGAVFAAGGGTQAGGPGMDGLVTAIATKFNLNKDDVQAVFNEQRDAMMAEHQQDEVDRLAQAVTDGKLTQAQADAITAKQAEEKTFMESLKDLSDADRKTQMEAHMAELKQWATDNNIPEEYGFFMKFVGPGQMGGGHGPMGRGDRHFTKFVRNNEGGGAESH